MLSTNAPIYQPVRAQKYLIHYYLIGCYIGLSKSKTLYRVNEWLYVVDHFFSALPTTYSCKHLDCTRNTRTQSNNKVQEWVFSAKLQRIHRLNLNSSPKLKTYRHHTGQKGGIVLDRIAVGIRLHIF